MKKNKKKKALLSPAELKEIEASLKNLCHQLSEEMHLHGDEIRQPISALGDDGLADREEDEILEKEDDMERLELQLVEDAIRRIAEGTFGFCLDCGKAIPIERFKAIPYAEYCVKCEEKKEK